MRRLLFLITACLVTATCGGRAERDEIPSPFAAAESIALPDPAPAIPTFVATLERPLRAGELQRANRIGGVAVAAPLALKEMRVKGPEESADLVVGAVPPLVFRSVAPGSTRDAEFVWLALLSGKAVVSFDASRALKLDEAAELNIGRGTKFLVGAFADNGVPNLVDLLIDQSVAETLHMPEARVLVVGAESGTLIPRLAERLRARLPIRDLERLLPEVPEPLRPDEPEGQVEGGLIGSMTFRILKNGFIEPDSQWVAANIAAGSVPVLGTVTCHRLLFPQLSAAFSEIESRGLSSLIDRREYGGCYVPRFIDRDPGRPLSMHAFGLAVDLNVSDNQLGTAGEMDPRIVEIFEKWGFEWGGRWARPDPMHFELARLLEP